MKVTMGNEYRTRDGKSVRLLCVDGPKDRPVVGIVKHPNGTDIVTCWASDGSIHSPDRKHDWDLVAQNQAEDAMIIKADDERVLAAIESWGALHRTED